MYHVQISLAETRIPKLKPYDIMLRVYNKHPYALLVCTLAYQLSWLGKMC